MSEPRVSVCIGTHNREGTIRECLDSVLAQTYRNLEVVVVDNASTDRTAEVAAGYGEPVRVIRRAENSGMCSTTRNEAARQARGDYLAFLDSDDSWYPDKLEKQVRFLQVHSGIPLCHAYCRLMDEDSREGGIRHEGAVPPTGRCFDALLDHCWITISTVVMTRALYEEYGPFREDLPYGRLGEDYEFFLRVARTHEIGFLPEVLARYRQAGTGISTGDWRNAPESFPFMLRLRERTDIWEGVVSRRRIEAAVWRSAQAGSRHWRDRGQAWRAAYFPMQILRRRPFWGPAWMELGRSLGRAVAPRCMGDGGA